MRTSHWTGGAMLILALVFAGSVFAQDVIPRKAPSGDPPTPAETGGSPWTIVNIPGLITGSTLGSVAVDPSGVVYVWTLTPTLTPSMMKELGPAERAMIEEPDPWEIPSGDVPGETGGTDYTPMMAMSMLYSYNGVDWVPVLRRFAETGVGVFVGSDGAVYASTLTRNGTVNVFHFDGVSWGKDLVAPGVVGPVGSFAGAQDVYLRSGPDVLRRFPRFGGDGYWAIEYSNSDLGKGNALIGMPDGDIMAPGDHGQAVFTGVQWAWYPEVTVTPTHAGWGGRDAKGALHLFVTGADADVNGPSIWQFKETPSTDLQGSFTEVFNEHAVTSIPSFASQIWAADVHNVFATGRCDGHGCVYRFDGAVWWDDDPWEGMAPTIGVGGTPGGPVWVSVADGRMIRFDPPGPTPPGLNIAPAPAGPGAATAPREAILKVRDLGPMLALVEFTLPEAREVSIDVFDVAGRHVKSLESGTLAAGTHTRSWNAEGAPSGVYFCRLNAGPTHLTTRIVLHR